MTFVVVAGIVANEVAVSDLVNTLPCAEEFFGVSPFSVLMPVISFKLCFTTGLELISFCKTSLGLTSIKVSWLVDGGWKVVLPLKDGMVSLLGIPADVLLVSVLPITVDDARRDAFVATTEVA